MQFLIDKHNNKEKVKQIDQLYLRLYEILQLCGRTLHYSNYLFFL